MNSVKRYLSRLKGRAILPDYDSDVLISTEHQKNVRGAWQEFAENFSAVSGRPMTEVADLAAYLKGEGFAVGYCDPELKDTVGRALAESGLKVSYEFDHQRVDDYAFGVTRASGVMAESGTVILNDEDTVDRLAALAPWVHVAVIDTAPILETVPEAIENLGDSSNVIWVTGPSKPVDIEGVHGPGVQICLKLGS